jgi:hypothetical protein
MSAAFYGALNAQREATEEEKSKTDKSPGFGTYIDVVAALVPAEILAANALLISLMVSTTEKDGKSVTEVTDPGSMKLMFVLSILLSVVLYVLGDRTRARVAARKRKEAGEGEAKMVPWSGWNYVRALIPAGAEINRLRRYCAGHERSQAGCHRGVRRDRLSRHSQGPERQSRRQRTPSGGETGCSRRPRSRGRPAPYR